MPLKRTPPPPQPQLHPPHLSLPHQNMSPPAMRLSQPSPSGSFEHHQPHLLPPATYRAPPPLNPAIPHVNRSPLAHPHRPPAGCLRKASLRDSVFAGMTSNPPPPSCTAQFPHPYIQTLHSPTKIGPPPNTLTPTPAICLQKPRT